MDEGRWVKTMVGMRPRWRASEGEKRFERAAIVEDAAKNVPSGPGAR